MMPPAPDFQERDYKNMIDLSACCRAPVYLATDENLENVGKKKADGKERYLESYYICTKCSKKCDYVEIEL